MVWYHYAFSLSQLVKIYNSLTEKPSWVAIEESLVAPSSLEAFLTQKGRPVPFKDPVLAFMQETWSRAHQYINVSPYLTSRASIWHNKKILIGKKPVRWEAWARTGINQVADLFGQTGMKSFAEIRREFNLDPREIWRFFQIRHCIKTILNNNPDPPSSIQEMFAAPGINRIRASKFYGMFREAHSPNLGGLRQCWEKDLGIQILEDTWKQLVSSWYVCSPETQSQLIQYKLLHRNYWTPSKLVRLKLVDNDTCWKCQEEAGTLVHMLYTCRKNDYLWDGIINLVNDIFKLNLSKSPAVCVLGLLPDNSILSKKQRLWMRLAFITGCRIILRHWKSSSPCSLRNGLNKCLRWHHMNGLFLALLRAYCAPNCGAAADDQEGSIRDLVNDSEGLVHRTYAPMPPTFQGELARDHFLQALLLDELRIQTLLAHPKSLQEAQELATERIRETTWGPHNDDAGPWGCVPTSCSWRNNPAQGPRGCEWTMLLRPGGYRVFSDSFKNEVVGRGECILPTMVKLQTVMGERAPMLGELLVTLSVGRKFVRCSELLDKDGRVSPVRGVWEENCDGLTASEQGLLWQLLLDFKDCFSFSEDDMG
ncbi:uncharacterized protein LOC120442039 [Oreochromis aureus]|uniref:uncharacterized protein LOC120442039 n=1 Tax=Oreochromis aureus TaxID=47969 RepID=UPI001952C5F8|nr:uncharacterized protein LOC120442039 [Oreochromis aureus]